MVDAVRSQRLVIRLAREADLAEVVDFYARNRDHLQPWSPIFPDGFLTEGYWSDQIVSRRAEHAAGHAWRAFIFRAGEESRVVGNLSLTQIERGAFQACVLGYSLDEAAQGMGLMAEAVGAAVAHAFGDRRLHRVMAGYMPHNRRSGAVLRRAGFVVEGYARDYLLINGRWEDHVLTALTNPEWVP